MNITLLIIGAGIVVSPLASLIKRESWSNQVKQTLVAGLSLIGGGIAVWLQSNHIDPTQTVEAWAGTMGVAQVVFQYGLKQTGLDKRLTAVGNPPADNVPVSPASPSK